MLDAPQVDSALIGADEALPIGRHRQGVDMLLLPCLVGRDMLALLALG